MRPFDPPFFINRISLADVLSMSQFFKKAGISGQAIKEMQFPKLQASSTKPRALRP